MADEILMCGNEAVGEAAIQAGCRFYAGYPITPQNELTAYMAKRLPEVGGIFIQSESELAAINMVYGASAAGARAMTSSSGPGMSLKQEGISYLAGSELPAVIVDVMRGGPGLGNIAPSQADYFQATRGGGHGDYRTIVIGPSSVQELAEVTPLAFELADSYRMPVVILADGILGQMMEPVRIEIEDSKERKAKPWALTGKRGRRANIIHSLYLAEGELEKHNRGLQAKYAEIAEKEVRYESFHMEDAELILVAYGTCARISRAAVTEARRGELKVGMIRPITLWPFPSKAISKAASKDNSFMVVEMSAGQMVEDVKLSVEGRCPVHFYGRTGGGVPTEEEILEQIKKL